MDKKVVSVGLVLIGMVPYCSYAGNGVIWHKSPDGPLVYEFVDSIDQNIENLVDELSARVDLNLSPEQSSALKIILHERGLTYEKKETSPMPLDFGDVKAGSGKVKPADWTK